MTSPIFINEIIKNHLIKTLGADEMMVILEYQRSIITKRFLQFSLEKLWEIKCLETNDSFRHNILRDRPTVIADSGLSLETEGIFAGKPFANRFDTFTGSLEYPKVYSYKTFGLNRAGEWLLIEIEFQRINCISNTVYEKACVVRISRSNLQTILGETQIKLSLIFSYFQMEINHWVNLHKRLYEEALKISNEVKDTNILLSLLE